ncbi:MAG: hypothetical protein LQ346_008214 [Caloplaca aetnensis]|nr:MAG: hypothetical protein LQ346_008214 [Caloplaca aetnensis]
MSVKGSVARIGPKHLLTSDPALTQRILSTGSRYKRATWFNALSIDPHVKNIVSETDPIKHNRLRYAMSAGYAGKGIKDMQPAMDKILLAWIRDLERNWSCQAAQAKDVDIGKRIQFLTVDIITQLCLGDSFRCTEDDVDQHDFLETVKMATPISLQMSTFPELATIMRYLTQFPPLHRLLVPSAEDKGGLGKTIGEQVVKQAIDARFGPAAAPWRDILESFLDRGLSRTQVETELVVSLVAGSDTTSTAIQATLLSIITNPRVYSSLQKEIDYALAHSGISTPIQDAEARELPYLQACIQEGLRIHPPLAQLRERVAPPEGDYIQGRRVPGGTCIGFNSWGTQRDAIYGDDPDIFRPERWLVDDVARVKQMKRTCDLVFGYGPTKCLGTGIAGMELNKVFFELLRNFDVTICNAQRPWKSVCWGIFSQEDLRVCIKRRTRV